MKKLTLLCLSFVLMLSTSCSSIDEYKQKKAQEKAEKNALELLPDVYSNVEDVLSFYEELQTNMESVQDISKDYKYFKQPFTFADIASVTSLTEDDLINGAVYYTLESEKQGSFNTSSDEEKDEIRDKISNNFLLDYEDNKENNTWYMSSPMLVINNAYKYNGQFDEVKTKINNANSNIRTLNIDYYDTDAKNKYYKDLSSLIYNIKRYDVRVSNPINDDIVNYYDSYASAFESDFKTLKKEFAQ